jgi:hypothetical protein
MAIIWKPLRISSSADAQVPPLLISASFSSDSYTIHLTDLANIWSETLDRESIIRRSRKQSTSIDPNDGDQLKIFLDKIKSGVQGGKDITSALSFEAGQGRPGIRFNIEIKLPEGLAPLKWTIHLSAEPNSILTNQLTFPLLEAQHKRNQEIESLEEILNQKDHVIQKLLDKFEEQGTQLGQIFPQAASKGCKVDREKAQEKVKGLAPFKIETWRDEFASEKSRDTIHLLESIFGTATTESPRFDTNTDASSWISDWWEDIRGETIALSKGKFGLNEPSKTNKIKEPPKPTLKAEESMQDEDDFQVQNTPPRVVSPPSKRVASKPIDDETTDDDDDDAPTQRSKIPGSLPSSPPAVVSVPKKKLGALGGKKQAPNPPSPFDEDETDDGTPSPKPTPKKQASPLPERIVPKKKGGLGRIGGKKEPPDPPREPTPPPAEPETPKKSKLGKIGGKMKELTPASPSRAGPTPEPPPKNEPTVKKKLGTIGGRGKTPTMEVSVPPEDKESRGRPSKVEKEQAPPPRETSEERADRRRLELKRELEAKAKAPVKKKRKF